MATDVSTFASDASVAASDVASYSLDASTAASTTASVAEEIEAYNTEASGYAETASEAASMVDDLDFSALARNYVHEGVGTQASVNSDGTGITMSLEDANNTEFQERIADLVSTIAGLPESNSIRQALASAVSTLAA